MSSVVEVSRAGETVDTWRPLTTVRVAQAGCGAVGSTLVRELEARSESLDDDGDAPATAERVA